MDVDPDNETETEREDEDDIPDPWLNDPQAKHYEDVPQGLPIPEHIAEGRLDVDKFARILESRGRFRQFGSPLGGWLVTVQTLYGLEKRDIEAMWSFVYHHWHGIRADMRRTGGKITGQIAQTWYDRAREEWSYLLEDL